jgi:hypothetical protein
MRSLTEQAEHSGTSSSCSSRNRNRNTFPLYVGGCSVPGPVRFLVDVPALRAKAEPECWCAWCGLGAALTEHDDGMTRCETNASATGRAAFFQPDPLFFGTSAASRHHTASRILVFSQENGRKAGSTRRHYRSRTTISAHETSIYLHQPRVRRPHAWFHARARRRLVPAIVATTLPARRCIL